MADEFSAELANGVAFVAGHDDDGRPVVVCAHAWTLLLVLSRCVLVRVKVNRVSDWSLICFSVNRCFESSRTTQSSTTRNRNGVNIS
jgi:hypothetical protein